MVEANTRPGIQPLWDNLVGRERDLIEILRHPQGLAEKEQKRDGEVLHPVTKEWIPTETYLEIYGNVLAVVLLQMATEFQKRIESTDSPVHYRRILARVPRGGLPGSDIWQAFLNIPEKKTITFDKEAVRLARKAREKLKKNPENVALVQDYTAKLRPIFETFQKLGMKKGMVDEFILVDDISVGGTTIELITEAYARWQKYKGKRICKLCVVVPTAAEYLLEGEESLEARIQRIAQKEKIVIETEYVVAYAETDSHYIQEVRGDHFQDHGEVHTQLLKSEFFGRLLQVIALRREPWAALNLLQMLESLVAEMEQNNVLEFIPQVASSPQSMAAD